MSRRSQLSTPDWDRSRLDACPGQARDGWDRSLATVADLRKCLSRHLSVIGSVPPVRPHRHPLRGAGGQDTPDGTPRNRDRSHPRPRARECRTLDARRSRHDQPR